MRYYKAVCGECSSKSHPPEFREHEEKNNIITCKFCGYQQIRKEAEVINGRIVFKMGEKVFSLPRGSFPSKKQYILEEYHGGRELPETGSGEE